MNLKNTVVKARTECYFEVYLNSLLLPGNTLTVNDSTVFRNNAFNVLVSQLIPDPLRKEKIQLESKWKWRKPRYPVKNVGKPKLGLRRKH